jgi:hypothetical protein
VSRLSRLGGALAVLAALALSGCAASNDAASTARTVVVADSARPLPRTAFFALRDCLGRPATCVNGAEGVVVAYRVQGVAPFAAADAVVLTDESCEPDRFGVSHCLNRLRLASGRELTVRHDHNMGNDPCLTPGESVRVLALAGFRPGA